MDSARITIINHDLSTTTVNPGTPEYKGFTVVKSAKGPARPVFITNTEELRYYFGDISATTSEMYELYSFISAGNSCWVSSAYSYTGSSIPVAYLTKDGLFEGTKKVDISADFEKLLEGDNSVSISGINDELEGLKGWKVLPDTALYKAKDSDLDDVNEFFKTNNAVYFTTSEQINAGSSLEVTGIPGISKVTVATKENTVYKTFNGEAFSKAYAILKGDDPVGMLFEKGTSAIIAFTDGVSSSTSLTEIILSAEISLGDVVATFYPRSIDPSASFNFTISKYSNDVSDLSASAQSNRFTLIAGSSIQGSLDDTDISAAGSSLSFFKADMSNMTVGIYVHDTLGESDCIHSINNNQSQPISCVLTGIERNSEAVDPWEVALEERFNDVNIFFDPEVHYIDNSFTSSGSFFKIADVHPLAGCVFNMTPKSLDTDPSKLSFGPNYWNVCNVGKVRLNTGRFIEVAMTGAAAANELNIIENEYGGVAPMYLGYGELFSNITSIPTSLVYDYSKKEQLLLDEKNFNPVINLRNSNDSSAYILAGHKTCKGGEVTDWSYIGHVASFLQFQREVRDEVMIPQVGKANNSYYRDLRAYQVEQILRHRIEGPNPIWAQAVVDTSTNPGVNDIAAQKARKFVINVRVKVNVFSEWVDFNFTNVAQDMDV